MFEIFGGIACTFSCDCEKRKRAETQNPQQAMAKVTQSHEKDTAT